MNHANQANHDQHPPAPWYKQTWLWFVLAPLIAVMIYAPVFMYLAVTTSDGIVKEDYYKVARGLNIDHSREQAAIELGIQGELLLDNLTGDVQLRLQANGNLPSTLGLDLVHPTHQKYDQSLTLRAVGTSGVYNGALQGALQGKRFLILGPADSSWQLRAELQPPYDQQHFSLGQPR